MHKMREHLTLHHLLYMAPAPRPPGLLALLVGCPKLKIPCRNSAVRKNAGLATTREPLYFGPRLPKMGKVAKIGCKTVVG